MERVAADRMRRIAIVGSALSFVDAPFHRVGWEIWTTSPNMYEHLPRTDRHFEIHGTEALTKRGYMEWLAGVDVWSFQPIIAIATIYPRARIEARFGTEFLTSTIAWMQALAIDEGTDVIGLWGVEMAIDEEYRAQRPGVKHFMGMARELGIETVLPNGCTLLDEPPSYPDNF